MQSIWLPFRQYSVSFRRWVGRPLRSAEANFIEAAERARQLADGSIIIVHGDISWPWRRNHFRSLWRRTRKNPFWCRYNALSPDPLLLKRRKLLRPTKIRYPLKTFNKRSDAPPRRLSPGVALLPLPQIPA